LHLGGERQQTMLQYIDDTKISIKGEEGNIWNIYSTWYNFFFNQWIKNSLGKICHLLVPLEK
jgi:hypothetical protein